MTLRLEPRLHTGRKEDRRTARLAPWRSTAALLRLTVSIALLCAPTVAWAESCVVPDPGALNSRPLAGCDYTSPFGSFEILDGLPPGTTIEFEPVYKDFFCPGGNPGGICSVLLPPGACEQAGGSLGGTVECHEAAIDYVVTGTGLLTGFSRFITLQIVVESHVAPRNGVDPVQTVATDVARLEGALFGDPDFDVLQLSAGTVVGMPSPGEMTLAVKPDGMYRVEDRIDLSYEIFFQGAPGSVIEGMAGTTTSSVPLETGVNTCIAPDNGFGTADLPALQCEYVPDEPNEIYRIVNGLPPGTTIEFKQVHQNFFCSTPSPLCSVGLPPGQCEAPGGSLGGNVSCHQSEVVFEIRGTGLLDFFYRMITLQLDGEFHTGPRNAGDPVQAFDQRLFRWQGEIFGDPDFCTLRFRAGDQLGLPSPGAGRLTELPDGTYAIDSFFDVTYEIDFVGCPGSVIEGFGGTSNGTARVSMGEFPASAVPGLGGAWAWLAATMLAISSAWLLRERRAQT